MRRIAVLTSGGDAPGMNAAIMAVAMAARQRGMTLIGIKRGYEGALRYSPRIEDDMMELDLESFAASSCFKTSDPGSGEFFVTEEEIDQTRTRCYKNAWGVVNISVFSSYYYLYGFEIKEELRGQGYGTTYLLQVLSDLANINPLPLRLQVSGDNTAALSLYKKTGFQITETLFGYIY